MAYLPTREVVEAGALSPLERKRRALLASRLIRRPRRRVMDLGTQLRLRLHLSLQRALSLRGAHSRVELNGEAARLRL